jgi:enoyl-CoA hydratase/carnithine racemase
VNRGVAFVTIDHPPMNLLDAVLIEELDRVGRSLEHDEDVRVAVIQSADPEFFIAHADINLIREWSAQAPRGQTLGPMHQMVERFRLMPKATIGKIEGRARGGGSELLLSLDMRFAALGRAILAQPEVAFGIIPGGGATQRLPRLIGRSRALEVILGGEDFDAELAERYGYVNRALPAEELTPFVEQLAYRIASHPASAIALAKAAVSCELPDKEGLFYEDSCFSQSLASGEAQGRLGAFVALGYQSRSAALGRK